jgi:hypothetical protein
LAGTRVSFLVTLYKIRLQQIMRGEEEEKKKLIGLKNNANALFDF